MPENIDFAVAVRTIRTRSFAARAAPRHLAAPLPPPPAPLPDPRRPSQDLNQLTNNKTTNSTRITPLLATRHSNNSSVKTMHRTGITNMKSWPADERKMKKVIECVRAYVFGIEADFEMQPLPVPDLLKLSKFEPNTSEPPLPNLQNNSSAQTSSQAESTSPSDSLLPSIADAFMKMLAIAQDTTTTITIDQKFCKAAEKLKALLEEHEENKKALEEQQRVSEALERRLQSLWSNW